MAKANLSPKATPFYNSSVNDYTDCFEIFADKCKVMPPEYEGRRMHQECFIQSIKSLKEYKESRSGSLV